jgi:hypothetical protein
VLEQGAEADETVPPSAETFLPSDKTDKTVQLSDKSGPPSHKATRTRRALSQPAQRRTPKPLDFVSTSASQPEVLKHMFGVRLCAVRQADSLFRGLPLAQAPCVYNVNGAPQQRSKYPRKNEVCYPLHFLMFFRLRIFRLCIIFLHKVCIIVLHKLCIITLHKLCIIILHKLCILVLHNVCVIWQVGPFSRSAPLREDVRDLGLSSEGSIKRDCDYAK